MDDGFTHEFGYEPRWFAASDCCHEQAYWDRNLTNPVLPYECSRTEPYD
jgi:hypothetical protein